MENVFKKYITFLVIFLSFQSALSAEVPPPPPTPGPVGLPIDGGVFLLLLIALVSGYYLSKKYIFIKKGSL